MSTEPTNPAQEALATKAVPPVLSDNPIVKKIVEETGASQMGDVAKVAAQRGQLDLLPPEFEPLIKKIKDEEGKAKVAEEDPRGRKTVDADVLFVAANIAANSALAQKEAEASELKDKGVKDFMKLLAADPEAAREFLSRKIVEIQEKRDKINEEMQPGSDEIAQILMDNKDNKRLIACLAAKEPDPNLTPEELAVWKRYQELEKKQQDLGAQDIDELQKQRELDKLEDLTRRYSQTTDPAERAKLEKEMNQISSSLDDEKEDRKKELAAATDNHEGVAKSQDLRVESIAKKEQAYEQKRAEGSKAAGNDDEYGDAPAQASPKVAARAPTITIDGSTVGPESALLSQLGEPMEGTPPTQKPPQGPDSERKQPPAPSSGLG